MYLDLVAHSFQFKLLGIEMARKKEDSGRAAEDLGKIGDIVRRAIDERLWPSIINYVLRQARDNAVATRLNHSNKIET